MNGCTPLVVLSFESTPGGEYSPTSYVDESRCKRDEIALEAIAESVVLIFRSPCRVRARLRRLRHNLCE